jgi:class 3 adenylate cyclase/TolB-like protein
MLYDFTPSHIQRAQVASMMPEVTEFQRRLSAVLVADVVSYTSRIEADTEATLAAWRDVRDRVIRPRVQDAGGRIVKFTGDGFLAEFPSVERAVTVAITAQRELIEAPLALRMGLCVGDVIEEEGDIFGESVNIAARLEGLAPSGGICISGSVHDAIRNRIEETFTDEGTHHVKNVSLPVHVWRWSPDDVCVFSDVAAGASSDATPPAILVEELKPAGDIDRAEEFADEVLDALVLSLSRRGGARIVTGDVPTETLRYRVGGRCRVKGDLFRVQLSLILAETGQTVWSRRFEHTGSAQTFLDELIRAANGELRVMLNAYDGSEVASTPDEMLDVKGLLSKAAFLFYRHDPKSTELSRSTMRRAVSLAPNNAMAVAMLAWSQGHMVPHLHDRVEDIDVDGIIALADRAVDLNPQLDFVFHNRAWLRIWLKGDHEGAQADVRRLLALNPDYHKGPQDQGISEIFSHHVADGVDRLKAVVALAPSEPIVPILLSLIGLGHILLGNMTDAVSYAEDAYERRPLIRLHGLVVAAAHADGSAKVGGVNVLQIIKRLSLTADDAHRLPFANPSDANAIADRLRRAGAPR